MEKETAQKVLKNCIDEDGGLYSLWWYLSWNSGAREATLDGEFTAVELEAIAKWMKEAQHERV